MESRQCLSMIIDTKERHDHNIEDLYFDFKSYDMKFHIDRQVLPEDMLKFAKYYRQILKGETSHAVSTAS